jgi:hypothetical protein
MKTMLLPSEKVRVAFNRFCELQGLPPLIGTTTRAFWAFMKVPFEDVKVHNQFWDGNEDSAHMLELLLGPHAEALLKAYNIRHGKQDAKTTEQT